MRARFTVRVLKGNRLVLCLNEGGADRVYDVKTAQAFKLATMLNFRAAQVQETVNARERMKRMGI